MQYTQAEQMLADMDVLCCSIPRFRFCKPMCSAALDCYSSAGGNVLTEPCCSLTGLLVSAPQGQGGGTHPKLALAREGTETKCPFSRAAGRADGSEVK